MSGAKTLRSSHEDVTMSDHILLVKLLVKALSPEEARTKAKRALACIPPSTGVVPTALALEDDEWYRLDKKAR